MREVDNCAINKKGSAKPGLNCSSAILNANRKGVAIKDSEMRKTLCAILGSGNIGTDLTIKVMRRGRNVEMGPLVGFNPASEGLARERGRR